MKTILRALFFVLVLYAQVIAASLDLAKTPTTFLRLGREGAEVHAIQSFKVGNANIYGATIALARRGLPTVPITVSVRSSQNGNDLASAVIQPSSGISIDPYSPTMISVFFNAAVAAGDRFLVVSAPTTPLSGSVHYYLSLGRYDEGAMFFKGLPQTTDLVGSVQLASGDSPPPPPPPSPPPPSPPSPPPPPSSNDRQGFGSHTLGGEGKPVYHVTNLNNSGAGSLRDALSQSNRYVVFDVAGNIRLSSGLRVTGSNITIDGCSAPGSGIDLIGSALEMRGNFGSHDIVVQCIRLRNSGGDGMTIAEGAYNIVVDRVSCANSGDGCIDIGAWNGKGTHDVTVQRSILSQSNRNMLIKYKPVQRISIHHNLFEGSSDRSPRISYDTGGSISPEIIADLRNNVIANWYGGLGTNVERGAKANIVGNYFTNPDASKSNQQQGIVVYNDGSAAYIEGNLSGDVPNIDNSPFIDVRKETVPFAYEPITEQDACSAAHLVLQQAGHPIRDALDTAIVARVSINCGK